MNFLYANLISVIWIGWMAYWAIAARGVKPVKRSESMPSRLAFVIPTAIAALLIWPQHLPGGLLGARFLPPTAGFYWIGVAVLLSGLLFSVWARLHLGRNWSGEVTVKQGHELIRTGPYGLVRHPIYTGILLGFVGSAIARGEWRGLIAIVIFLVGVWRKLKLEERFMTETFGEAYARYRAEVPALIPFVL